jgi:hypothetical protein
MSAITVMECAQLASKAYDDHPCGVIFNPNITGISPIEKKDFQSPQLHGIYLITDLFLDVSPVNFFQDTSFEAKLFVKFSNAAPIFILSFRGTLLLDDFKQDFICWKPHILDQSSQNKIPKNYPKAVAFLKHCLDYIASLNIRGASVVFTGHSLGGAYAKLLATSGDARRFCSLPYMVVGFNSPGVEYMPHQIPSEASCIHNINAYYGLINHIGGLFSQEDTIYLHVREDEETAKNLFESFDTASFNRVPGMTLKLIDGQINVYETFALRETPLPFIKSMLEKVVNPLKFLESVVGTVLIDDVKSVLAMGFGQHGIGNLIEALNQSPVSSTLLYFNAPMTLEHRFPYLQKSGALRDEGVLT